MPGVDFDPENVARLRARGFSVVFGDAEDPEFPASLPLAGARWTIGTLPQWDLDAALAHSLRQHGSRGRLALTAHTEEDAARMRAAGRVAIPRPFNDAADFVAEEISGRLEPPEGGRR